MNLRKVVLLLTVFLLASMPQALAQGTYTQIDYPGALQTVIVGINTAGDLVGTYEDTNDKWHGFLLSGGLFTNIDYPLGTSTAAYGINDVGQIVGSTDLDGFLYDINSQRFTLLHFPNTDEQTAASGINNAGEIIGFFRSRSEIAGFLLSGDVYEVVRAKRSSGSEVNGINNLGQVVGTGFGDARPNINFMLDAQGNFQRIKVQAESVTGINDAGEIVGEYRRANGVVVGFVLPNGGPAQQLIFPGAGVIGTLPFSINNSGVAAGWFVRQNENHGFTWTPPADKAKK